LEIKTLKNDEATESDLPTEGEYAVGYAVYDVKYYFRFLENG